MGLPCDETFRQMAQERARNEGWTFEEIPGSMLILKKLLHGEWDDDFLVVEPGRSVKASHGEGVIEAEE